MQRTTNIQITLITEAKLPASSIFLKEETKKYSQPTATL